MAIIDCTVDRNNWYRMYIEFDISTDIDTKLSTITHALKLEQLTNTYDFNGTMNVTYYIGESAFSYKGNINIDDKGNKGYTITIKSGTTTIQHDTLTGDASFIVSCSGLCDSLGYGPGKITLDATTVDCSRIPLYTLGIVAGSGSHITVQRISSGGGSDVATGVLSAGENKLYYGDKLKITFTADTNYGILTRTVNGTTFASGNTYTVSGHTRVVSAATPLISEVGATDAYIGSVSTISIKSYNIHHTHTLMYEFGNLTGEITSQSSASSLAWTIPTTFYAQIPNAKSGLCTITCITYNGDIQLGTTSCRLTVTASPSLCEPTVMGQVIDTNPVTLALTGSTESNPILIRYKSTAKCTITATAQNAATITSTLINNVVPSNGSKTFANVVDIDFIFHATDSRGYATSTTVSPTIVKYIQLTCNPIITRTTPTGSAMVLNINGSYYQGSFGAKSNTLKIEVRYAAAGETYSDWMPIDMTQIIIGTSTYRSNGNISLGDNFDYRVNYEFQVRVKDGTDDYVLSSVTKTVPVARGIPVCDWGENDFNFNVPVMLNNVHILNIMYPIGAVFMHTNDTLPDVIQNVGTWESVPTELNGIYAWKRTE